MAARSIWKGVISFGMVSIPVKLYGAAESNDISLNQLHAKCGGRIQMPRWCPTCEDPNTHTPGVKVEAADIIKGYAVSKDKYIQVTKEDLESVQLESLKAIQVDNFVPWEILEDFRRVEDQKGYFLAPEEVGAKAFVLFTKAMEAEDKVGIAKIAVREKEQLCAVIPFDGILFLQTLHWEDELKEYGSLIPMATVSDAEMAMAKNLITAMTKPVDLAKYKDTYRERLKEVLEAKLEGRTVEPLPEVKSTINDLEAMLKASLAAMAQ